jgi:hypothetical protein
MQIRKIVTVLEETLIEGAKAVNPPLKKVAVVAVLKNPFAGRYVEDLSPLIDEGDALSRMLVERAVAALGPGKAESFGKAGIVGADGEIEHVAAITHPKFGAPIRDAIGGGKAIIPSAKKRGGPGTSIDIPMQYKDAAYVRSHFDAFEVRIPDAPNADEIVVALALSDGGRPHARIGGLKKSEVSVGDGQR